MLRCSRTRCGVLVVLVDLFCPTMSPGQTPDTVRLLPSVRTLMKEQLASVRNYSCLETVRRYTRESASRPFRRLDTVVVEVVVADDQETFSWPGSEASDMRLRNLVGGGLIGTGAFASHLRGVFLNGASAITPDPDGPADALSYRYSVPSFASGYKIRQAGQEAIVGYRGSFALDPTSHALRRFQLEPLDIPLALGVVSASTVMTYGNASGSSSPVVLPESATTEVNLFSGEQLRNLTLFSHCRNFTVASSVLFASAPPPEEKHDSEPVPTFLPPGLSITTRLESRLDSGVSAVGEAIHAVVLADVRRKGKVVVPAGSRLSGRIRRLQVEDGSANQAPFVIVALELSTLRLGDREVRFYADLDDVRVPESGKKLLRKIPGSWVRESEQRFLRGGTRTMVENQSVTYSELPGVASFFVSGSRLDLSPDILILTWRTKDLPEPQATEEPAPEQLPVVPVYPGRSRQ